MNTRTRTMTLLTTVLLFAVALPAVADDDCRRPCRDRRGPFLGLSAGWGVSIFEHELADGRTLTEEAMRGAAGGLRLGYAFSDHFALGLAGHGYGGYGGEDEEWGVGAAFLTTTWWPDGGGFFLRLGVGGGGGDLVIESSDEKVHFTGEGAALFGLGYEWKLGRSFALGVAADAWGFELDGAAGLEKADAGVSSVSVQFNWYL